MKACSAYLLGNKGPWRVTEQENNKLISTAFKKLHRTKWNRQRFTGLGG